jgi:hypothetical protein
MSKEIEIKLKREVVFEEASDELYDVMEHYFGTKEEIEQYQESCDVIATVDTYTNSDSKDIPIKDMKELIQRAEDAGANFIQIDYHCDHEEYEVYGSKITRLDEEAIIKLEKKKADKAEMVRLDKIKVLKDRLAKLEKS